MQSWMVTLRRAGGRIYEPVEIRAADKEHAAALAKIQMGMEWDVKPDAIEVISVEIADPS
jgi:hypothetical protein